MPCFSRMRWNCFGHLAVEARSDAVEHLDHRDLRAEPPPHRAELEPDIAGADHHHALRHLRQRQGAGGGNDGLLVDGDAGDRRDLGAGGNHDVLGFDRLLLAVDESDLDLPRSDDAAGAVEMVDLVLLEQELDALHVALHALILEGEHGGEIELGLNLDAHAGEAVGGLGIKLARMEQRL